MTKNLLLISNSTLHDSGYLDHCAEEITKFLGERKNVLFIPFARPGGITHDEYTKIARERFEKMGFILKGIHEFKEPKDAVKSAESIFIGGGNTFVLTSGLYEADIVNEISSDIATTPDGGVQADTGQAESRGEASAASRNDEGEKGSDSGDEKASNDKTLPEWVCAMRKAPKKSISEWRHKALDKLGFIW